MELVGEEEPVVEVGLVVVEEEEPVAGSAVVLVLEEGLAVEVVPV